MTEAVRAAADDIDTRALPGRLRELLEHRALVECVGPLSQPLGSGEPIAELVQLARLCRPGAVIEGAAVSPRRTLALSGAVFQNLGDLVAAEPVLGRARLDLLTPGVGLDPVLLALARIDRGRLRGALAPQRKAALSRRALHLVPPARELLKRLACGTSLSSAAPFRTGPHSKPSRSVISARRCA